MKNTITLSSRYEMPLLGFGTYKLTDPKADEAAIVTAIRSGYRLLFPMPATGGRPALGGGVRPLW